MVTKGKVIKVLSKTEVRVSIPMYGLIEELEGEAEINEMPKASVATIPGCEISYREGDVVLLEIEDNNLSNPVIVGLLQTGKTPNGSTQAIFSSLRSTSKTELSEDTAIGKVTSENIKCLTGINSNIQRQLDDSVLNEMSILGYLSKLLLDESSKL